ncbi:ABC transporter [Mycolicibacterium sp. 050232]|uniref:ABC transporter n=1 Tax=Mycolicibacterium sp. 050232 TaxID=3113982 RepID=UPI002E29CB35|nr:ABC transporter [Mycolicibacterium sp. 050232]MED5814116.1 ABC transporter [Mycolicibacterium sp. 050232]
MLNRALVTVFVALLVAGCATTAEAPQAASPRESQRPVTRLVLVERQTGAGAVFGVEDSVETGLGQHGHVDAVSGDGRYAYLKGDAGVTVLDSGAWTFDHGDHSHYYDGPPAVVGRIDGPIAAVRASGALAVVRGADGAVATLDRDAFARGEVTPAADAQGREKASAAVPLGSDLLTVTERGLVTKVAEETTALGDCPAVTDAAVLRRAVVLGCRDGALKISRRSGAPVAQSIPFVEPPHEALGPFGFRRQGTSLAAVAGDEVWLLNGRRWASMRLPGVVAVNTADADTVLALSQDGVLHALDVAAGVHTGRLELLDTPVGTPVIEVGAGRAYVNDATARAVHEIDYANGLRVARTHRTTVVPDFLVAAGW